MAPMMPGIVPFGITTGMALSDAGLSPVIAIVSSVVVFAGAAQLAALQLISEGSLPIVVFLSACIINLRFSMYSASLAPYFASLAPRWTWTISYLLSDQACTVTLLRAHQEPHRTDLRWFYLGGGMFMWITWQMSVSIGVFAGSHLPLNDSLSFALPLVFMGLLISSVVDRATTIAAFSAASVAVIGNDLPMNLGFPLATIIGIFVGIVAESRANPTRRSDGSDLKQ
jgi:4-azaleucine resistance transporter AzlC